jgi:hypothetical protein
VVLYWKKSFLAWLFIFQGNMTACGCRGAGRRGSMAGGSGGQVGQASRERNKHGPSSTSTSWVTGQRHQSLTNRGHKCHAPPHDLLGNAAAVQHTAPNISPFSRYKAPALQQKELPQLPAGKTTRASWPCAYPSLVLPLPLTCSWKTKVSPVP